MVTLDRIVDDVRELTMAQQQQLRDVLDGLLRERGAGSLLDQEMLAAGVIARIPPPISDLTPYRNRKPARIRGKPLSETIIEDRR